VPEEGNGKIGMKHRDVRNKLSAYIDGEVSGTERLAIESHLQQCSTCSEALEELQRTILQVKSLEEQDPPEWLTRRIMTRVREEAEEPEPFWRKLFFPLHVKLPLEAIAMAFLVVTGAYLYRNIQPDPHWTRSAARLEQKAESSTAADRQAEPRQPAADALSARRKTAAADEEGASAPALPPSAAAPQEERSESFAVDRSASQLERQAGSARRAAPDASKPATIARTLPFETTLVADDPQGAVEAVEKQIKKFGGQLLQTEMRSGNTILTVEIPSAALTPFLERLREFGRLQLPEEPSDHPALPVLRITVSPENSTP